MPRIKRTRIDADTFNKVKAMITFTNSTADIMKITNLGHSAVCRIKKAATFDEYRQNLRIARKKYLEKKGNAPIDRTPIDDLIRKTTKVPTAKSDNQIVLERIASALERLVIAWESEPKRKGLFGK